MGPFRGDRVGVVQVHHAGTLARRHRRLHAHYELTQARRSRLRGGCLGAARDAFPTTRSANRCARPSLTRRSVLRSSTSSSTGATATSTIRSTRTGTLASRRRARAPCRGLARCARNEGDRAGTRRWSRPTASSAARRSRMATARPSRPRQRISFSAGAWPGACSARLRWKIWPIGGPPPAVDTRSLWSGSSPTGGARAGGCLRARYPPIRIRVGAAALLLPPTNRSTTPATMAMIPAITECDLLLSATDLERPDLGLVGFLGVAESAVRERATPDDEHDCEDLLGSWRSLKTLNDPTSVLPYNFSCSIPDFTGATRFRRGHGSSFRACRGRSTS